MSSSGSNAPRSTAPLATLAAAAASTTLTVTDVLQLLQKTELQIRALTTQIQNLTTNQAAAAQAATQVAVPRPPESKKTA